MNARPYTFVAADALVLKVREGGRVVNVHALLATGVTAGGHREIRRRTDVIGILLDDNALIRLGSPSRYSANVLELSRAARRVETAA